MNIKQFLILVVIFLLFLLAFFIFLPRVSAQSMDNPPVGFIDSLDAERIVGWAYDADENSTSVYVDIYIDNDLIDTIMANLYRSDLLSTVGSAYHGFNYVMPGLDSGEHQIAIFVHDVFTTDASPFVNSPQTITIGATPASYILVNDFNDDQLGQYSDIDWKNDWRTGTDLDAKAGMVEIIGGSEALEGKSLSVSYPEGWDNLGKGFVSTVDNFNNSYDELYLSYWLKFDKDFDFVRGGKLPGLCGGTCNMGTSTPNGTDGWSARLHWRENGSMMQYVYNPDQPNDYGQVIFCDAGGQKYFKPGNWHHVQTRVVMNTPGENDGIIQSWLDDELALDIRTLRFRDVATLTIDRLVLQSFFGGDNDTWAPTKDENIYFDKFIISTDKIEDNTSPIDYSLVSTGFIDTLDGNLVSGWAYDANIGEASVGIDIYIDNDLIDTIMADLYRADLATVVGSANHGFSYILPELSPGNHEIAIYLHDNTDSRENPLTNSPQTVSITDIGNLAPVGYVDVADFSHISGWAYDPDYDNESIFVHIYLDGVMHASIRADLERPDLLLITESAWHGFNYQIPQLEPGEHEIHVYAINRPIGDNPELSNSPQTVTQISSTSAIYNLQVTNITSNSATVSFHSSEAVTANLYYGLSDSYTDSLSQEEEYSIYHTFELSDLNPSEIYHFQMRITNQSGHETFSEDRSFVTRLNDDNISDDVVPPTYFQANRVGKNIHLSWLNPDFAGFAGVELVRRLHVEHSQGIYNASTVVYSGQLQEFTDTNLNEDFSYEYSIRSYNYDNVYSSKLGLIVR